MADAALYEGVVTHARLRPRRHRFRYRVFSLLVDIDRIGEVAAGLWFFSYNRLNLFALYDRDHGPGTDAPLRPWVEARLREAGVGGPVDRIELLAFPRVLGRVFAPLSLFLARDPAGRLVGAIYEVHNTFGERHAYALPVDGAGEVVVQGVRKAFHVSPFFDTAGDYAFRLRPPGRRFSLFIRASDAQGDLMHATHAARRRPLSDAALLAAGARFPLMAAGTMAGILWQAARLWLKGLPVHPHPRKRAATAAPPR